MPERSSLDTKEMQRKKNKATEDDRERDASRVREVMSKKTFCVGCKLSSLSIVSNLDIKR